MATAVSMDDLQKACISLLQASATAYGAGSTGDAADGSNRQYASSTEIDDAILYADAEICDVIINTPGHPFQPTFLQTSSLLNRVSALPARNGIITRVVGLTGSTQTVVNMDGGADTIEVTAHGFSTGDLIQFITTVTVGGGLSINTDYYVIYVTANTFSVATSYLNAIQGTAINLSLLEPEGTSVIQYSEALQAASVDEVKEVQLYNDVFQTPATPYYYMVGDYIYLTVNQGKVNYTDYTKTSAPQAPEPYRNAIVAGAIARLLKDGSDEGQMQYFNGLYSQYLQLVSKGATIVPSLQSVP